MSSSYLKRSVRKAVTLVEVIFSIGVVLIGLLGLLSILPLAGKRAQDSISLSVAPVIANNVQAELLASKYLSDDRLGAITFGAIDPSSVGESNPDLLGGPSFPETFPLGYYQQAVAGLDPPAGVTPSFCIDPMCASLMAAPYNAATPNSYYVGCFPYYKQNHDPMKDPSSASSSTWQTRQPRMFRVGVKEDSSSTFTRFINVTEALRLTENQDDLIITRGKDKSLPATFKNGQVAPINGGLEYGKRIPSGEYSWIATVNPLPGGVYASVSVAVIRRRLRSFDASGNTIPPPTAEGNALGERLAYVTYASGFKGGAGGVVHLASNANTVPKILPGSWIMLSRFSQIASDKLIDYHRWYRVVSVDGTEERYAAGRVYDSATGSAFTNNVWLQKLTLEGPDWEFSFPGGYATTPEVNPYSTSDSSVYNKWTPYIIADAPGNPATIPFSSNTYATMVEGVVSVTERIVKLSDL
ncbi:MAG: hypothetical protein CMM01_26945 [Rhodopirellula sp.]|nr:hypothetical protein [Rhodopirellula sp.]